MNCRTNINYFEHCYCYLSLLKSDYRKFIIHLKKEWDFIKKYFKSFFWNIDSKLVEYKYNIVVVDDAAADKVFYISIFREQNITMILWV